MYINFVVIVISLIMLILIINILKYFWNKLFIQKELKKDYQHINEIFEHNKEYFKSTALSRNKKIR